MFLFDYRLLFYFNKIFWYPPPAPYDLEVAHLHTIFA